MKSHRNKVGDIPRTPRYERWKKPEFYHLLRTFDDDHSASDLGDVCDQLDLVRSRYYKAKGIELPDSTPSDWMMSCKELIYDVVDGKPVFYAIGFTFNVNRAELQVGPLFDILVSESGQDTANEIRSTLAHALFLDVPVVPNTENLASELARHYRDLMVEGITAPDKSGNHVRLKLTESPGMKIESLDYLRNLPFDKPRQPAELILLREAVERELNKLSTADRVLGSLSLAIEELTSALDATTRNEHKLQRCLTSHPILFGLEYQRLNPQHRLGAEYTMDYALERVSGIVDLVEIEASTLDLFNKSGDPKNELVHAEQQVLDWLEWLEKNSTYARGKLPGLLRPKGFVVIGRSTKLSDTQQKKLARRNALFGESLQVLTYDDLLARAKNMQQVLVKPSALGSASSKKTTRKRS